MKDSKWLLIIPIIIFMIVGMCVGSLYFGFSIYSNSQPPSVGPANPEELCAVLGISDSPCNRINIILVIEHRFPLGVTTRDEVEEVLGIYMIGSSISNSQDIIVDDYVFERNSFLGPHFVSFFFDQKGILTSIFFQR